MQVVSSHNEWRYAFCILKRDAMSSLMVNDADAWGSSDDRRRISKRFVGDIKRCYRQPSAVYADVEAHHARYHAANGGQLVEKRIVTPNELNDFVASLEADPRTLWGNFIGMTDGKISCRIYENESTAQDSQTQHISVGSRGAP